MIGVATRDEELLGEFGECTPEEGEGCGGVDVFLVEHCGGGGVDEMGTDDECGEAGEGKEVEDAVGGDDHALAFDGEAWDVGADDECGAVDEEDAAAGITGEIFKRLCEPGDHETTGSAGVTSALLLMQLTTTSGWSAALSLESELGN